MLASRAFLDGAISASRSIPPITARTSVSCPLASSRYTAYRTCAASIATRRLYSSSLGVAPDDKPPSHLSYQKLEQKQQRKTTRRSRTKPSLKSAAVEAEASATKGAGVQELKSTDHASQEKVVAAYCASALYDLSTVKELLWRRGISIDPCGTALSTQVVHIELPTAPGVDPLSASFGANVETGDVFIFPSGNVVAWDVPEASVLELVQKLLWVAASGHHRLEDESFGYKEDGSRERSFIQQETIILGTKVLHGDQRSVAASDDHQLTYRRRRHLDTILAKIAFSSGLARSTKIAVLETQLEQYLEGTKGIPETLMSGNLGLFSRSFIYQKMGQLLDLRRQLNLSSDLTDSLPDLFWDVETDLGLENYYDRMSNALDTRQRIKSLNDKMDYAHEIASILREELSVIRGQQSEKHSTRLEWIIIILIMIEVGFGSWELYKQNEAGDVVDVRLVDSKGKRKGGTNLEK